MLEELFPLDELFSEEDDMVSLDEASAEDEEDIISTEELNSP